jgi:hypothetical protein
VALAGSSLFLVTSHLLLSHQNGFFSFGRRKARSFHERLDIADRSHDYRVVEPRRGAAAAPEYRKRMGFRESRVAGICLRRHAPMD